MSPREDSTVMEAGAERSGSISAGDAMCLANVKTHVAKDAVEGTESEKSMTLLQGLKTYPQAVAWSMLISTCASLLCLKGKMERKIADYFSDYHGRIRNLFDQRAVCTGVVSAQVRRTARQWYVEYALTSPVLLCATHETGLLTLVDRLIRNQRCMAVRPLKRRPCR